MSEVKPSLIPVPEAGKEYLLRRPWGRAVIATVDKTWITVEPPEGIVWSDVQPRHIKRRFWANKVVPLSPEFRFQKAKQMSAGAGVITAYRVYTDDPRVREVALGIVFSNEAGWFASAPPQAGRSTRPTFGPFKKRVEGGQALWYHSHV